MNDCTLYDIHLCQYVLGGLTEPELSAVEQHLTQCAACQAELVREMELRTTLGSLPHAACPDSVTRYLEAALDREQVRDTVSVAEHRSPWWPAGLGLIAAALLAVLLIPGLVADSGQMPSLPHGESLHATSTERSYTTAEIAQARHDVITTLVMAAGVLDRNRDKTIVNVFGARLPEAISGSLRSLDSDARITPDNPNAPHTGGNG